MYTKKNNKTLYFFVVYDKVMKDLKNFSFLQHNEYYVAQIYQKIQQGKWIKR